MTAVPTRGVTASMALMALAILACEVISLFFPLFTIKCHDGVKMELWCYHLTTNGTSYEYTDPTVRANWPTMRTSRQQLFVDLTLTVVCALIAIVLAVVCLIITCRRYNQRRIRLPMALVFLIEFSLLVLLIIGPLIVGLSEAFDTRKGGVDVCEYSRTTGGKRVVEIGLMAQLASVIVSICIIVFSFLPSLTSCARIQDPEEPRSPKAVVI
eukprot:c3919_g1_i1.p1 GENE.c3919_g1_i1~~c3919_g1_i1.p1  ORF type:complete len:212 (-),score=58.20 c3919_g1_i1:77-712(-)